MLLLSRLIIVCLGKQNRKMRLRSDVRDQRQIQLHSLTQKRRGGRSREIRREAGRRDLFDVLR